MRKEIAMQRPTVGAWSRTPRRRRHRPTYRESTYRRPLIHRLTPLSWFLIALLALGVLASAAVVVQREVESRNGMELLSERLYGMASLAPAPALAPSVSAQPAGTAAEAVSPPTSSTPAEVDPQPAGTEGSVVSAPLAPAARPVAVEPLPVAAHALSAQPTPEPFRAPWAAQLVRQADGALMAPAGVVAGAITDLSGYYAMLRDLPMQEYLAVRDEALSTYFTGALLEEMRQIEAERRDYAMNRAGTFEIQIQNFAPDGLTAVAGIITRGWVNDLYDLSSQRLKEQGQAQKDLLVVMAIVYNPEKGRWQFASRLDAIELRP